MFKIFLIVAGICAVVLVLSGFLHLLLEPNEKNLHKHAILKGIIICSLGTLVACTMAIVILTTTQPF